MARVLEKRDVMPLFSNKNEKSVVNFFGDVLYESFENCS